MTLATTYLSDLSRVRLAASAIPAGADHVKFERSTDGVVWETVRGGTTVPVVASAATLDDYEFEPDKINTYRASYVDTADIAFVAQGTHVTGNNASVVPGLPAGLAAGHTMVLIAAIRNSGTGFPNTPAGWTTEILHGNLLVATRRWVSGDAAPTVTFTGGVANASTSAVIAAWSNMQSGAWQIANLLNATSQNILVPGLANIGAKREIIAVEWKQNGAASSASTLVPFGATITLPNATGDGQSLFYSRVSAASNLQTVAAQTLTVTGGATAISRALMMSFRPAEFITRDTQTITPAPDDVWLKNPQRPSLNTPVTVTGIGDITRVARTSVTDVIGRTYPVAVTDVQGSRQLTLTITVPTLADYTNLDVLLTTGEPLLIQPPSELCDVPGMYVIIGDIRGYRNSKRANRRYFDLPVIEVAAPAGSVAGTTITWNDVVATYATWDAVVAAKATWSDLVSSVSTAVVIVP